MGQTGEPDVESAGALAGGVDNGRTVQLEVGKWSGRGGVRVLDGACEVAFFGRAAGRFPLAVKIDGVEATATASRKSDLKGMTVLIVDWVPPSD